jgi:hypothetical protein
VIADLKEEPMSEQKPYNGVLGPDDIPIGQEEGKNVPFFESLMPGGLEGVLDEFGPREGI